LATPSTLEPMTQKRTSHEKATHWPRRRPGEALADEPKSRSSKTVPQASGIPVFCHFDKIVPASELNLYPGNYKKHPPKQLDRMLAVIQGTPKKPGNGYRRAAVVSLLSGCVTKGNGLVQMAQRSGLEVPIEYQVYRNRAEEIRDLVADNKLAALAVDDDDALRKLLSELSPDDVQLAAVSGDELEQLLRDADIPEAEFPITAKLGESYDYVLIFCTNATEYAFLQNLVGLRPERSYKKTGVGLGRAIPLERALAALRENRHSLDVQGGNHDHAQAPAKRVRVRPGKPARGVRKGRRK